MESPKLIKDMTINTHHINSPVSLTTLNLGITENYRKECIQEAYKLGDKQSKKTNVKAIMSGYRVWEETNLYNPLLDKIILSIEKIVPLNDPRFHYELVDTWYAIYKEGHYTIPHNHIPSSISFVYYLKTPPNTSPLIFDGCNFKIDPYDNLLVIFPSYLTHSVPKHEGEDRICLAGNLNLILK